MSHKKPRILFIMHMPPPVHGAAMVGKYIHDSQRVNEAFECRYINLATAKNLEDIGHASLSKLIDYWHLVRRIRKEVKAFVPDMVYVTPNSKGGAFYKDFVVVEMLKRMGCQVVIHFHNKGVRLWQDRWLDDMLYKRFFRNLKVILLADALYADVEKYVRREDPIICANGIPDIEVSRMPHDGMPLRFLFLSNLLIDKGVLVLLDAIQQMKEKGYVFVCDFVGGETADIDAQRFENEVSKRGLTDIAIYRGRKYNEEKEEVFSSADIFVLPTYDECYPLVLLEAMQHGLPCISTNVGGISSIIEEGKTGFIVEERNAQALENAMVRLYEDETLRKEMGKCGREKYEREMTLDVFEKRLTEILQSLP